MKKNISKIFSVVCSAALFPGMLNAGYVSAMENEEGGRHVPRAAGERPASPDDGSDLIEQKLSDSMSAVRDASSERDKAIEESEKEAEVIKKLDERLQKSRSAMEETKTLLRSSLGNVRKRRLTPGYKPDRRVEDLLNSFTQESEERDDAALEKALENTNAEMAKAVQMAKEEEKTIKSLHPGLVMAEIIASNTHLDKLAAESKLANLQAMLTLERFVSKMEQVMSKSVSKMEQVMSEAEVTKTATLSLEAHNRVLLLMKAEGLARARKQAADKAVEVAKAKLEKEMCDAILQKCEKVESLNVIHLEELRAHVREVSGDLVQERLTYDNLVREVSGESQERISELLSEPRSKLIKAKQEEAEAREELRKVELESAERETRTKEARRDAEVSGNKLIEAEREKKEAEEKVKEIEGNNPEELASVIEDAKKGKFTEYEDQMRLLRVRSQNLIVRKKPLLARKIKQIVENRHELAHRAHSESAGVILNSNGTVNFEKFALLFIFNLEKLFNEKFRIGLLGSDDRFVNMIVDDMFMQEYEHPKGFYYKFIASSINAAEKILFEEGRRGESVEYFRVYGEFFKNMATSLDAISEKFSTEDSVIDFKRKVVDCVVIAFNCLDICGTELSIDFYTGQTAKFKSFASKLSAKI